ncbi:hypothetical protein F8R90_20080 [Nostoc sp. NZL]|nr:hypothetical protein [Nostoc sp. NZL]
MLKFPLPRPITPHSSLHLALVIKVRSLIQNKLHTCDRSFYSTHVWVRSLLRNNLIQAIAFCNKAYGLIQTVGRV